MPTILDPPPAKVRHDLPIAGFQEAVRRLPSKGYVTGGSLDVLPHVYTDTNLGRIFISYRVSDHYPLWARFGIDGT